ncbi:MAG: hypothetical protein HC794_01600 [Nitrospiraceae bacterium]|nr:hypothetical protein [Nitrospiraceae bacterium]
MARTLARNKKNNPLLLGDATGWWWQALLGLSQAGVLVGSWFVFPAVASAVTLSISPAIVVTGPTQNVSASPTNGGALVFDGTSSLQYGLSLAYFKQAFAVAFADLYMPKGLDFGAREVMDGISLRIIRDYAVLTDLIVTRCDVLYGVKTIRPELACRIASN